MTAVAQIEFPYACLDFSGREVVTVKEIARKLGYSTDHVARWIEDDTLPSIDGARRQGSRPSWRVPVEAYRSFVLSRLSGPGRTAFLEHLPKSTLRALHAEISTLLAA